MSTTKLQNYLAVATGADAVVTLDPDPHHGRSISQILYSYSGPAGNGRITITSGGKLFFDVDIPDRSGVLSFPHPLGGGTSEVVVITLAGGDGSTVGKLNVLV
jgi:hypothetical protein